MKECIKCGKLKELSDFHKDKSKKDGLRSECKKCTKEKNKKYQQENREKIKESRHENREKIKEYYQENREKIREGQKKYRQENREKVKEKKKKYYQENREKIREGLKKYRQENREKVKEYYRKNREKIKEKTKKYQKNRRKTDVNFKLSLNLRSRLHRALKNNQKTGSAVRDLGCSIEELKTHLEAQFEPGMSWDNWSRTGWHIDHIIPLSSFDLTNREELLKACHYTNLQPMWAKDNLKKGSKIEE